MTKTTSPYQDLLTVLESLRQRTAGFHKVALHVHSTDSHDWNRTGDRTLNDRGTFLAQGGENGFMDAIKRHFDSSRAGNEVVSHMHLANFIDRVHAENDLCIAAHVNSQQGVRHHFRQTDEEIIRLLTIAPDTQAEQERDLSDTLKEYPLEVGCDALEIAKATDKRHYRRTSTVRGRQVALPVIMQLRQQRYGMDVPANAVAGDTQ